MKKLILPGLGFVLLVLILSGFKSQGIRIVRDGYYKFSTGTRVIAFFEIQGNKISYYRTHAGHYAAFGRYSLSFKDSTLVVHYFKTIASRQFSKIELFNYDTLKIQLSDNKEAEIEGLTFVDSEHEDLYNHLSKSIRRNSKEVRR